MLLCAALASGCVQERGPGADLVVTMTLSNGGAQPLRCRLMFGHWVDRDLGELAAGASVTLVMQQSSADGALYVLRADGQRQMMIETIQCARPGAWMATFGQVDFAPIRATRARAIDATCAAPGGEGRVVCRLDRFK